MKKIFFFILVLLLFSCSNSYFFDDFNQVIYYKIKKEPSEALLKKDSLLEKVFCNDFPEELENSLFDGKIKSSLFAKQNLKSDDFMVLKNIFSERFKLIKTSSACAPLFRDILVFKKNQKTVGIAKLCFDCDKYYFIGNNNNYNTDNFGQNNEFEDLKSILDKYKK